MDEFAAELRGQIPEDQREAIIGQVHALLAIGASPLALQIAVQVAKASNVMAAALNLI